MKKVSWKISIFLALLILITLLNCSSDNKSENNTTIITPPTSKTDLPQNYYMPEIPRISVHEVKAKLDSGANIVIVDVRYPEYYDKSHISGAISLPEPGMKGPYTMLNGYNEIYTYCT